jgi:hypothetical protein
MSLTRQSYIGSFLGTDHRLLISFFEGMTLLLRKSSAPASKAGTRAIGAKTTTLWSTTRSSVASTGR